MRKCKGKYYKDGKCEEFAFGYFHKWGIGYEHSVIGDIKVDTAIVELMNGEIITPYASDIKFIDECNEEKNDEMGYPIAISRFYFDDGKEIEIKKGSVFVVDYMNDKVILKSRSTKICVDRDFFDKNFIVE